MVIQVWNVSTQETEVHKDREFRTSLDSIVSVRLIWATRWDHFSKEPKQSWREGSIIKHLLSLNSPGTHIRAKRSSLCGKPSTPLANGRQRQENPWKLTGENNRHPVSKQGGRWGPTPKVFLWHLHGNCGMCAHAARGRAGTDLKTWIWQDDPPIKWKVDGEPSYYGNRPMTRMLGQLGVTCLIQLKKKNLNWLWW